MEICPDPPNESLLLHFLATIFFNSIFSYSKAKLKQNNFQRPFQLVFRILINIDINGQLYCLFYFFLQLSAIWREGLDLEEPFIYLEAQKDVPTEI